MAMRSGPYASCTARRALRGFSVWHVRGQSLGHSALRTAFGDGAGTVLEAVGLRAHNSFARQARLRPQDVADGDGHEPPVGVLRGSRCDDALALPSLVRAVEGIPLREVLEVRHHVRRHEGVAHHVGLVPALVVGVGSEQTGEICSDSRVRCGGG